MPPYIARVADREIDSEVVRNAARADMAEVWVRAGRHAAAERLLREVATALERRRAPVRAAGVWQLLGRLLLDRGRAGDACRALEAAVLAAGEGAPASAWDARVWQAVALTETGQLVRAESLATAALEGAPTPGHAAWAAAVLTDVRLWQRRWADTPPIDPASVVLGELACVSQAVVRATLVRRLLVEGRIFEAGQVAGAALREGPQVGTAAERAADGRRLVDGPGRDDARQVSIAWVIAATAHLRVACAAGDLDTARMRRDAVLARSFDARAPVHAMRARLIFANALGRAGRANEAEQEWRRLRRAAVALPPLLREAVARRESSSSRETQGMVAVDEAGGPTRGRTTLSAGPEIPLPAWVPTYLPTAETDDHEALRALLTSVATAIGASRLDVAPLCPASDQKPSPVSASPLVTVGRGLSSHVASLVCERGAPVGPVARDGGWDVGVPVWFGAARIAIILGRWEGTQAHDSARDTIVLAAAVAAPRVAAIVSRAEHAVATDRDMPELVGGSAAIARVRNALARAARAPFAVLIEGESGVGKELAARAIHRLSVRHAHPFGDINCAALPDDLIDAELFGHARGAFTGAVADRAGLFESADGGTLFLDEVAELSPRAQAKLLRVLQQQEVRRVGEAVSRRVDVRIVSAANRDLRASVAGGLFRHDLLYRLDVIRVPIPPLRDRPEDVPVLARRLWEVSAAKVGTRAMLTERVVEALQQHRWPGNVRELQNVMAALAVAAPAAGLVDVSHLPAGLHQAVSADIPLAKARAAFERSMVGNALGRAAGNHARAAHALGISRQGLAKMCARLGVAGEHRRSLGKSIGDGE